MSWPTPQDYNEAIQDPQHCFSDPELCEGVVEMNSMGLPKPYSGGFATVYKVTCKDRVWAVRCFQRELTDRQERYRIIGEHLRSASLDAAVGFDFLPQGIRVMGQWYPVVKMEWVEGPLLHEYITQNLARPKALLTFAQRWIELLASLRAAGVAHGDLQHGNIIITGGRLKLIDYDGMYVPGLAGYPSLEDGHRNYQHPTRSGRDFGPHLDRFSGWLIFLSTAALIIEPKLWYTLDAGDECLLFRRHDYEQPEESKAMQAILFSRKSELRSLAGNLRALLAMQPAEIPDFDGVIPPLPAARPSSTPASSHAPAWVGDHVSDASTAVTTCVEPAAATSIESQPQQQPTARQIMQWLAKQDVPPAAFPASSLRIARVLLAGGVLVTGACIAWTIMGDLVAGLIGLSVATVVVSMCWTHLRARFRSLPVVAEQAVAIGQIGQVEAAVQATQSDITALESERQRVLDMATQMDEQLEQSSQKLDDTLFQLHCRLKEELGQASQKRESIKQLMEKEAEDLENAPPQDLAGQQARADKFAAILSHLSLFEQEAQERHDVEAEMAQRDHIRQRRDLIEQSRKVKQQVAIRREEVDGRLERLRRTLLSIQLDLAKAQHNADRFRTITFGHYLGKILHG